MRTLDSKTENKQRELRERRLAAGLTIDELARRSVVERSRVSRAERGYLGLRGDELSRIEAELTNAERRP